MKKVTSVLVALLVLFSISFSASAQSLMVYGPEFFDEVAEITGYVPEYECDSNETLTIHFANGNDFTTSMHLHDGDDIWLFSQDVIIMRENLLNGDYGYEWVKDPFEYIELDGTPNRGLLKVEGIEMPFEISYSEYLDATIVAYGTHVVEVNPFEIYTLNDDKHLIPCRYFVQAFYLGELEERENI